MIGVILQPNYIPWRGYFDLIHRSDIFVFLDDIQYTRRDWRNRNLVKSNNGLKWLSVPVISKGQRDQLIKDTKIDNSFSWSEKHWETLKHCYSKAKCFGEFKDVVEEIYRRNWENLCELDIHFIEIISRVLNIQTEFVRSSLLNVQGRKTEKLVGICRELGITTYISGPKGAGYIERSLFENNGIEMVYHKYDYPEYPQSGEAFEPNVTILDLIFNCGKESPRYIWEGNN